MAGGTINWWVVIPDATRNLVRNPSFELSFTNWFGTGSPTASRVSDTQVFGAYAGYATGATNGLGVRTDVGGSAGTAYTASAYVKLLGTSGGSAQISLGGTSSRVPVGTDWTRIAVGSTGAVGSVAVQRYSGAEGTLWYDAIQVEAGSITTYIDGDQAGGYWEGAPHNSPSYRSAQERSGGTLVPMSFIGFRPETVPDTGMWPITNILQSYAVNAGAEFQRSRPTERTFTLTATFTGTSLADQHVTRRKAIDALKAERVTPPQPNRLYYTGATGTTYIDALYDSGLGWSGQNVVADEGATVRFVAPDPAWYDIYQEGTSLAPYTVIGSTNYVAYRDPEGRWGTFGVNGTTITINASAQVRSLQVYAGTVFVGGPFYTAGGTRAHAIAQHINGRWGTLTGVIGTNGGYGDGVYAMTVNAGGTLFAAGAFLTANGTQTPNIAMYKNAEWGSLAGGTLTNAALVTAIVNDAQSGGIYVGGNFTNAAGTAAPAIARWTGAWGTLVGGTLGGAYVARAVRGLAQRSDMTLGVAGDFLTAGGSTSPSVAFWRNNAWGSAPGGTTGQLAAAITLDLSASFYAVGTIPPLKYRSGDNTTLPNISGVSGQALYTDARGFIHLGAFSASLGTAPTALPLPLNYAVWNGYTWLPPDMILSSAAVANSVYAITQDTVGTLYLGGGFVGVGTAASVTPVVNTGISEGYPTMRVWNNASGTSRIYQLLNTTTGDSLWFNYVMGAGEIITLVTTPGNRSFTSTTRGNIFGAILGGSNIASWRLLPGTNQVSFLSDNPGVVADLFWNARHSSIDGGATGVIEMAPAGYSVYLSTPAGIRLADASAFLKLKYARTVNSVGSLMLTLPGDFDTSSIVAPDGRIEVWRRLASGREYLDTDTVWFIQTVGYAIADSGERTIVISADSGLYLLREPGRFVDAYAGSSGASKTAAADDMIKAIVREQAGASASAARSLSAYMSVQADSSAAPSIAKAFAWRPVLTVMQEIAQASFEAGTYLAFDVVAPTPDTLEFQTFTQQRGVDHRFPSGISPVLIGPDMGNMGATTLVYDWRDEVSYTKAGGSGEGSARLTSEYLDSARAAASPFRRREVFVQATNTSTAGALDNEASSAVRAGRPRVILQGKIASTPDTQYGVDWQWGDFVTVQAFGQQLDARVDAISVEVTPDNESIEAVIRSETYL